MTKYTDEQLSRILSAAAEGMLVPNAVSEDISKRACCLEQAAWVSASMFRDTDSRMSATRISKFDGSFHWYCRVPPDHILRWLEKRGWA